MKKIGTWGNFSDKFKRRFKIGIYVTICVLIYVWTAVVGAQTWIESLILYENKSGVLKDIENFAVVEISEVYANGDFTIDGYKEIYTEDDIEGYARIPAGMKPYYHLKSKYFITPITIRESEQICMKFVVLDILCYIMLVVLLYDASKSTKKWKKVVMWLFFLASILIAQCDLDLTFGVLFDIGAEMDWVIIIKILIPIGILICRAQILKRKYGKSRQNSGEELKKSGKRIRKSLKK